MIEISSLLIMTGTNQLSPLFQIVETRKFFIIGLRERSSFENVTVLIDLVCAYTESVVRSVLLQRPWVNFGSIEKKSIDGSKQFQIADFENIDWAPVLSGRHQASSYLVRKGLSRKAQLSLQIKRFLSKNPTSVLANSVPITIVLETWNAFDQVRLDFGCGTFASFDTFRISSSLAQRLEFCLDEVRETFNEFNKIGWIWILKPSVTNKGADIFLTRTWSDLLARLAEVPDIREWVLQRYIDRPLLILNGHKFHLRVYCLCVGALTVYVFDRILVLIAAHPYSAENIDDIYSHLTNTARSAETIDFEEEQFVQVQ